LWYAATDDVCREGFFCCKKDDGPAVNLNIHSIKLFGGREGGKGNEEAREGER